jgi:predicted ATPase
VRAHLTLGYPLFWLGDFARARVRLEHAVAGDGASRSPARVFVQDPAVTAGSSRAATLWLLGFPDQSLKAIDEAVTLAESLAHPFSLAMALYFGAMIHQFRREDATTLARAEALASVATEGGFAWWAGASMIWRAWVRAEPGQSHDTVAEIRRGLAIERSSGTLLSQPYGMALLGDTCGRLGLVEEGLDALAEALDVAGRSEERMYEAEMHRLRAELLVKQDRHDEARTCLDEALRVARAQEAKSLELRAAMSLARLEERYGKPEKARRQLAETYAWFTEGLDTADLRDARALLDAGIR